ncbi:hypothetical protein [Psychrobacter sp. P2G3]|uniref:hypothetical protein n=1 Tax=Psychrobacter sp. P2G3 TaxID=1699622 RepID=UPI001939FF73|nr:hypothetical protein [Psychrobacter sp. P2G3]
MSHSTNQSKYTRRYHPRHPLAQYAITQIDTLELRAQDIVKIMGYPLKHTIPACERLRHVLSNKHLGLDSSYIDKCFTAEEFLVKLFLILDIPYEPFVEDIAQIKYQLAHLPNYSPKYSLPSDVGFRFNSVHWMSRDATKDYKLIVEQKSAEIDKVERKLAKASGA